MPARFSFGQSSIDHWGALMPWSGIVVTMVLLLGVTAPASAQREVKKIGSICPLGYIDLFNGTCSTLGLMDYQVKPTEGKACPSGWINAGGDYCRRKL